jgi:hypothetical protein
MADLRIVTGGALFQISVPLDADNLDYTYSVWRRSYCMQFAKPSYFMLGNSTVAM